MAQVAAFHSSNPTDPDVHHVCSRCGPGQQIPERNRVSGTGGHRRCQVCADLLQSGSC